MAPLWKALATNNQLARKVVTLLYIKLKLRPPQLLVRLSEQAELVSMLVRGPICACTAATASSPKGPVGGQGNPAEGLISSQGLLMLSPRVGAEPLGLSQPSQL